MRTRDDSRFRFQWVGVVVAAALNEVAGRNYVVHLRFVVVVLDLDYCFYSAEQRTPCAGRLWVRSCECC